MRKFLPAILLALLVPAVAFSQGLQVSSMVGTVEIRQSSSKTFQPLTVSARQVLVGDEIRTGAGASVVLTAPDASVMVVQANSDIVVHDTWSNGVRSSVNILIGRVRFYVEKLGGRPNPYRVETPTALIAVRGTVFDVAVDLSAYTEVICTEGQVVVEAKGLPNREVIVNPGWHTLVVPGQAPLPPAPNDVALLPNRTLKIQKKGPEDSRDISPGSLEQYLRDNDKMSRPSDRKGSPGSQSDPNVGRAKPTLNYPE
jgi:FecR protein